MREGFARMDERFEAADQRHRESREDMMARFEKVDKRFEQVSTVRMIRSFLYIIGNSRVTHAA